jgi:hypothetical protein
MPGRDPACARPISIAIRLSLTRGPGCSWQLGRMTRDVSSWELQMERYGHNPVPIQIV